MKRLPVPSMTFGKYQETKSKPQKGLGVAQNIMAKWTMLLPKG